MVNEIANIILVFIGGMLTGTLWALIGKRKHMQEIWWGIGMIIIAFLYSYFVIVICGAIETQ